MTGGVFHRILFEHDISRCLEGVARAEGRFHHDGQPALYMSPSPSWAWRAVEPYVHAGDPPRVAVALGLSDARLADLRDAGISAALGIDPEDAVVPWLAQIERGERPASWRVSDAVRESGADGMIYPSRRDPARWHVVLFRWNVEGGPRLAVTPAGPAPLR